MTSAVNTASTEDTKGTASAAGKSSTERATNVASAEETERSLRNLTIPIIGRIENDRLLLDVRTIFEDDYAYIAEMIAEVLK